MLVIGFHKPGYLHVYSNVTRALYYRVAYQISTPRVAQRHSVVLLFCKPQLSHAYTTISSATGSQSTHPHPFPSQRDMLM